MRSTTINKTRPAFALSAFGFELRLWQESNFVEWGALIDDGKQILRSKFQEDNLTLAKLHLLEEARSRALGRSKDRELPPSNSLVAEWHEATVVELD